MNKQPKSTIRPMVPLKSNDAATGPNPCDGIALPLLGSNQDSPDPESPVASAEDRASVLVWVFTYPGLALPDPSTPPAPAQGPHSEPESHDSAQGQPHRFQGPVL